MEIGADRQSGVRVGDERKLHMRGDSARAVAKRKGHGSGPRRCASATPVAIIVRDRLQHRSLSVNQSGPITLDTLTRAINRAV